jgi:hypothetical protein
MKSLSVLKSNRNWFFLVIILFCPWVIFGQTESKNIRPKVLLTYNVSKSALHLALGGYSFDPELRFMSKGDFIWGISGGLSKYYRRENGERNYANYSSEGFYIKPQIGYMFFEESSLVNTFLSLGLIYSKLDESVQPFIPGSYFGNFYGPPIQRSNLRSLGGEVSLDLMFNLKSRFSIMLNARMAMASYPNTPDEPLINRLPIQYMPGVGNWLGNWTANGEYNGNNTFFSLGIGAKVAYRIF